MQNNDTITAIATGKGGAIAVIRVSGNNAVKITDKIFKSISKRSLVEAKSFSVNFGEVESASGETLDEVLVSIFRAPKSYTGEDMVEISCHGSEYIQKAIVTALVDAGARPADPGEFTQRAFLNGKLDLVQAEAVADLIASQSKASAELSLRQMRGGYSSEFAVLRDKMLNIASMLELELDFSEEDVQFADREALKSMLKDAINKTWRLMESFRLGNAIKNGVPTAIVGAPNAGKSTLLNALLGEDRAMVSDVAGTTRDTIEETLAINDMVFRFIDTAGLRNTSDRLELMGIERTLSQIELAAVVLLTVDATDGADAIIAEAKNLSLREGGRLVVVLNKCDKLPAEDRVVSLKNIVENSVKIVCVAISAKDGEGIDALKETLSSMFSFKSDSDILITNIRHYNLLSHAHESLTKTLADLDASVPTDFVAQGLRESLHHLGTLTGEINTTDILTNIFQNFCIGK